MNEREFASQLSRGSYLSSKATWMPLLSAINKFSIEFKQLLSFGLEEFTGFCKDAQVFDLTNGQKFHLHFIRKH